MKHKLALLLIAAVTGASLIMPLAAEAKGAAVEPPGAPKHVGEAPAPVGGAPAGGKHTGMPGM